MVQTESSPADEPTDEMMNDVRNDQLHIKLTYDMKGIPKLNTMHGKFQMLHFHRTHPFEALFLDLAEFVTTYLATNEAEYYTSLGEKGNEHCLLLRPVLIHSCPLKRRAFTFDDSGVARLDTIGDLLCNSAGTAGIAETNIEPQLSIELRLVETLKRAATDPVVVIRSGALKKDIGGLAKFYRIGVIPSIAVGKEETSVVSTSDTIFWRIVNDPAYPTLSRAPTWIVRDLKICNPDEGEHLPATSNDIRHIEDIENVDIEVSLKDKGRLTARVEADAITPFTDGRLMYSFKTFGKGKTTRCPDPMTAFPLSNISLALRFTNHLTSEQAAKLSFSTVVELEVDETDDYYSIRNAILEGFKTASHGNSKPLFKAPLADSFDMQFWVLPQIPDCRTLYRYSGREAELYSFLNKRDVEEGDLSLFMEVHLVDKDAGVLRETKEEVSRRARSDRCAKREEQQSK